MIKREDLYKIIGEILQFIVNLSLCFIWIHQEYCSIIKVLGVGCLFLILIQFAMRNFVVQVVLERGEFLKLLDKAADLVYFITLLIQFAATITMAVTILS